MMKRRDVAVLILCDGDKILLQKRSKTAKRFPQKWGLFGGGIEEGECPLDGLKREIFEELNLKLDTAIDIYDLDYKLDEKNEVGTIYTFISRYHSEKLELNEGEEMRWVGFDEVLNYDLSNQYRKILEYISKNRHVLPC